MNDNHQMGASEIASRLDWVRPVMTAMRANVIPETVAQETTGFLLERLDAYLDAPRTG